MKISIIVPIYGVEDYLIDCIDSVRRQTSSNWELILVDDGSKDKCPQICDDYSNNDERIKVLHKDNGGLVSARKAGLSLATGDYAMCLDGDDYLENDCLKNVCNIIERYSPDVICFGFYQSQPNRKVPRAITEYREGFYSREQIETEIFDSLIYAKSSKSFSHCVWAKCYKMDLYREEQLAVSDKIKIGEDFVVTKPILYRAQSMYILQDCYYNYRYNPASMTKNRKPFDLDNYEFKFNHIANRINIEERDFRQQLYRSTAHCLFVALVSQFYNNKGYADICRVINSTLDRNLYKMAVKNADYTPILQRFMLLAMRHKLYVLMWLYSKVK